MGSDMRQGGKEGGAVMLYAKSLRADPESYWIVVVPLRCICTMT